jgi:hypothetical protein
MALVFNIASPSRHTGEAHCAAPRKSSKARASLIGRLAYLRRESKTSFDVPHCRAAPASCRTEAVRTILGSVMASSKKEPQLHDVQ